MPTGERSKSTFNLHYAPHFGMFRHSAGDDLVDQISFAADQGFTAWEDNGMKGRDKATQERIAAAMSARGMRMGVFVAHSISWNESNLTSGDAGARGQIPRRNHRICGGREAGQRDMDDGRAWPS